MISGIASHILTFSGLFLKNKIITTTETKELPVFLKEQAI